MSAILSVATDLLAIVFAPVNLIVTIPLLFVTLYWLFVIFGAMSSDAIDVDVDAGGDIGDGFEFDADAGVDADAGLDVDGADVGADGGSDSGGGASGGLMGSFLVFINAHHLPLMVVLGLFVLTMWTLTMLATAIFNPTGAWLPGLGILAVAYVAAIFATKAITAPLARAAEQSNEKTIRDLTGRICQALTPADHTRLGQAEVEITGAPLRLTIQTREGVTLSAGQRAVVVRRVDPERDVYLVEPAIT